MKNFNKKMTRFYPRLGVALIVCSMLVACSKENMQAHKAPINTKKVKEHLIPIGQAVEDYRRYTKERIDLSADTLKQLYGKSFEDTRMVWFDLETIKSYIAYIEKRSAKEGVKPDGLQFYFSVHGTAAKQPNQQSFFIAPTVANKKAHSGYTFVKQGDSTATVYLKDALKGRGIHSTNAQEMSKAAFFHFLQEDELDGTIFNLGSGTPPDDND